VKISADTISILKNFSSINSNILIDAGSILVTQDSSPKILARAEAEEIFPVMVAIFDLNQFLATLTMMAGAEAEFGERSVVLSSGKHSVEYFYANSNLIRAASTKILGGGEFFSCEIKERDVIQAMKAAAIFSSPMLSFVGKGGKVELRVGDIKTPASNSFRIALEEKCDREFSFHIEVESLKIIPGDYVVELSEQKFVHFKHTNGKIQYWLAVDPSSKVQ